MDVTGFWNPVSNALKQWGETIRHNTELRDNQQDASDINTSQTPLFLFRKLDIDINSVWRTKTSTKAGILPLLRTEIQIEILTHPSMQLTPEEREQYLGLVSEEAREYASNFERTVKQLDNEASFDEQVSYLNDWNNDRKYRSKLFAALSLETQIKVAAHIDPEIVVEAMMIQEDWFTLCPQTALDALKLPFYSLFRIAPWKPKINNYFSNNQFYYQAASSSVAFHAPKEKIALIKSLPLRTQSLMMENFGGRYGAFLLQHPEAFHALHPKVQIRALEHCITEDLRSMPYYGKDFFNKIFGTKLSEEVYLRMPFETRKLLMEKLIEEKDIRRRNIIFSYLFSLEHPSNLDALLEFLPKTWEDNVRAYFAQRSLEEKCQEQPSALDALLEILPETLVNNVRAFFGQKSLEGKSQKHPSSSDVSAENALALTHDFTPINSKEYWQLQCFEDESPSSDTSGQKTSAYDSNHLNLNNLLHKEKPSHPTSITAIADSPSHDDNTSFSVFPPQRLFNSFFSITPPPATPQTDINPIHFGGICDANSYRNLSYFASQIKNSFSATPNHPVKKESEIFNIFSSVFGVCAIALGAQQINKTIRNKSISAQSKVFRIALGSAGIFAGIAIAHNAMALSND